MLSNVNEFVLSIAAIGVFFAAIEIGFRLGLQHDRGDEGARDHIRGLQSALLGLLALLLGFNFVMASSRFGDRKELIQEEVNGIATTWQRAQLLPSPSRQEISKLLQAYVSARIDFMRGGIDEARLEAANTEATGIEAQIWKRTSTMVTDDTGGSQVGLFVLALNDMVSLKWKRRDVLDNHVPEPVLYLLCTVAAGALGFIGYGYGLTGRRRHISTAIFAVLIGLVFATILDFDRPRGGFIRVGEEGMIRLQAAFAEDS
jgi:hypothetical protein